MTMQCMRNGENDVENKIGKAVTAARIKADLSLRKCAKLAGMEPRQLSEIEQGRIPTDDESLAVNDVLGEMVAGRLISPRTIDDKWYRVAAEWSYDQDTKMTWTINSDEKGKRTVTVYRGGQHVASVVEGERGADQRERMRVALQMALGDTTEEEREVIDATVKVACDE